MKSIPENVRKERAVTLVKKLSSLYPDATTALVHRNPLQLLVATILSAQCTDERVNMVTPGLFRKYPTAAHFAAAVQEELEQDIHSTGFFRAKAKNIIGCCRTLVERHGGKVPQTLDELVHLPGVGRKTANVVLGSAFGITAGIVVDTHVKRLAGRLGFTRSDNPELIEQDLMKVVPERHWILLSHLLILHGRSVCQARKPLCGGCVLNDWCPSAETGQSLPTGARGVS